jgi:hypothetical protein
MFMNLRFMPERKCPKIMAEIIDHHKIIFKSRDAKHLRGPDITMNVFKRCRRAR